ncbi:NUDIX hydrolase [Thalassobius sp. Cn5-15]|jgi:8-oxo-dGTP diphosphatase|uniref:NUDIX hydrolase n=1 Tax=Thalassobius sp. Cn5-15 TaxID=2917763 RepID=UPI001EF243DA|nr:NUDIX hydrolase [Thalassobius sp. Cn5-15]MCG7493984.1 NUDIX hydrolase [Thalassobius sp. Cn5-15]
MIRRFGQVPRSDKRYKIRPGAYVILPRGRDMLVTFQEEPTPEYQLPGGGVDAGESSLVALHREAFEETGWSIAYPRRLGAFRRYTFMPEYDLWAEKVCTIYIAHPVRQICAPLEEGHSAHWLPIEAAAELLGNEGDRHFVQKLL